MIIEVIIFNKIEISDLGTVSMIPCYLLDEIEWSCW